MSAASTAASSTGQAFGKVLQFESKSGSGWHDFPADLCLQLEKRYSAGERSLSVSIKGQAYTLDFAHMVQRSSKNHERRIQWAEYVGGWQYEGSHSWHDYDPDISEALEAALHSGQDAETFEAFGSMYEVIFGEMKQFNVDDPSRCRRVRRSSVEPMDNAIRALAPALGVPSSWAPMFNRRARVNCKELVPLFQRHLEQEGCPPWSRDRETRAGSTQASFVRCKYIVSSVERLQDLRSWEVYTNRRQTVIDACNGPLGAPVAVKTSALEGPLTAGGGLVRSCNEVYLFHGSERTEEIIRDGFDTSLASPGSLLGDGKIYLAELAGKSDEYTGRAGSKLKLLCNRVLLGKSFLTRDQNPTPAQKAEWDSKFGNGEIHSIRSHRAATTGITEFAVADAASIYPEYVITYERRL